MKNSTSKPFYKRLWFIALCAFILLGALEPFFSKKTKTASATTEQTSQQEVDKSTKKALESAQEALKNFDISEFTTSKDAILLGLTKLETASSVAESLKSNQDKEISKLASSVTEQAKKVKSQALPKLRKAYIEHTASALWEENITVTGGGQKIRFTGAIFANNKNIKNWQEGIQPTLERLEFTRSEYAWYKSQEDYTYYDF